MEGRDQYVGAVHTGCVVLLFSVIFLRTSMQGYWRVCNIVCKLEYSISIGEGRRCLRCVPSRMLVCGGVVLTKHVVTALDKNFLPSFFLFELRKSGVGVAVFGLCSSC